MFQPVPKPHSSKRTRKQKKQDREAKAKLLGVRTLKVSTLKKRVWKLMSMYIRKRDCGDGYGSCISCGRMYHFKDMQAGHYIAKSVASALYFHEDNLHAQCVGCNIFKHGNQLEYGINLRQKIGQKRLDWLLEHRHDTMKWTVDILLDLEAEIHRKLDLLES